MNGGPAQAVINDLAPLYGIYSPNLKVIVKEYLSTANDAQHTTERLCANTERGFVENVISIYHLITGEWVTASVRDRESRLCSSKPLKPPQCLILFLNGDTFLQHFWGLRNQCCVFAKQHQIPLRGAGQTMYFSIQTDVQIGAKQLAPPEFWILWRAVCCTSTARRPPPPQGCAPELCLGLMRVLTPWAILKNMAHPWSRSTDPQPGCKGKAHLIEVIVLHLPYNLQLSLSELRHSWSQLLVAGSVL